MTLTPEQHRPVISDGLPSQLPDVDPAETREGSTRCVTWSTGRAPTGRGS